MLDFFISRKVSPNFIDMEENLDLDSDHSANDISPVREGNRKENMPSLANNITD